MDRLLKCVCRVCIAATAIAALAGCGSRIRHGLLDGYETSAYAAPCRAAFIGFHGPVERCMDD